MVACGYDRVGMRCKTRALKRLCIELHEVVGWTTHRHGRRSTAGWCKILRLRAIMQGESVLV